MLKKFLPLTLLGFFSIVPSVGANTFTQTTSTLDLLNGLNPIAGSNAQLTRDTATNQVSYTINTNSLPEGAYTNWWVVFNNPSACVGGCGEDDFARPGVDASAFYATGNVVGSNGIGNFTAQVGLNSLPTGFDQVLFGNGLTNLLGAEIQTVIRWHGPLSSDPALAALQLNSFNGGCTTNGGVDGLFACQDRQLTAFAAVPENMSPLPIIGTAIAFGIFAGAKRKRSTSDLTAPGREARK
ncbi:hypothetical protein V0288_04850 [Pannus brasiliensis CCIBt3594]|uniref:PEP-CTERM sorting domain-containing protein n=1 Tax=Pannus brasiliensis CCIBt3594 TaxID=1427578 RepID=A0AAW9QUZ6_9CHRO